MQIANAQIGNTLYPLVEGQPLPIAVGEIIKVFYAFRYKMPKTADVGIWASVYKYSLGLLDRQGQAQTKEAITLQGTLDWKDYSGEIDIVIGDMPTDVYGLILELPGYDVEDKIDDCLEIAAAPSMWGVMGNLLMLGLLFGVVSMITPAMEEGVK